MRIAQVAPLFESVPPQLYGGTERVVSYLTEELVKQGHEVTLFASGDSVTSAQLVAPCSRSLRLDTNCVDQLAHHLLMIEQVRKCADLFDVIHFHIDYLHFPCSRRNPTPHLTTLHGRLDLPDLVPLYQEFCDMPVVSISMSQRQPLPFINWVGNVYHGLPEDLYEFRPEPGKYLAFIGRISPEKGVDRAIQIAKRFGMNLKIAAKVDRADREYFEQVIKPLLNGPLVEFIGEIGEDHKGDFLGNALAYVFPIDWPEPFGLTMIESMACGTPVITYPRGSVPEVMVDGVTGFVVNDEQEAGKALERVSELDRKKCREVFEKRFSVSRMAQDYLTIYNHLLMRQKAASDAAAEAARIRPQPVAAASPAPAANGILPAAGVKPGAPTAGPAVAEPPLVS